MLTTLKIWKYEVPKMEFTELTVSKEAKNLSKTVIALQYYKILQSTKLL